MDKARELAQKTRQASSRGYVKVKETAETGLSKMSELETAADRKLAAALSPAAPDDAMSEAEHPRAGSSRNPLAPSPVTSLSRDPHSADIADTDDTAADGGRGARWLSKISSGAAAVAAKARRDGEDAVSRAPSRKSGYSPPPEQEVPDEVDRDLGASSETSKGGNQDGGGVTKADIARLVEEERLRQTVMDASLRSRAEEEDEARWRRRKAQRKEQERAAQDAGTTSKITLPWQRGSSHSRGSADKGGDARGQHDSQRDTNRDEEEEGDEEEAKSLLSEFTKVGRLSGIGRDAVAKGVEGSKAASQRLGLGEDAGGSSGGGGGGSRSVKSTLSSLNPLEQDKGMFPKLSMMQRVRYFIYSFCGATVAILLAFPLMMMLMTGLAALLISLSNIGYIIATGLIVGFKRQLRSMGKPKRIGCVSVFFLTWFLTVRAALGGANFIAVAVLACCQLAAYVYYLLSYIPYGRKGAQKLASAAMK